MVNDPSGNCQIYFILGFMFNSASVQITMHLEPVGGGGGVSLHSDFDDMDVLRCTGISFLGILRFLKCTCKCTYLYCDLKNNKSGHPDKVSSD